MAAIKDSRRFEILDMSVGVPKPTQPGLPIHLHLFGYVEDPEVMAILLTALSNHYTRAKLLEIAVDLDGSALDSDSVPVRALDPRLATESSLPLVVEAGQAPGQLGTVRLRRGNIEIHGHADLDKLSPALTEVVTRYLDDIIRGSLCEREPPGPLDCLAGSDALSDIIDDIERTQHEQPDTEE